MSCVFNLAYIFKFIMEGVARGYTDNGDGTVTDNATGLIWQKCSRGQNNDATCSGTATTSNWSTAVSYCNSLTLAGKTWRLPNVNELKSIADRTKPTSPAIDTTYFPNIIAAGYLSSTTSTSSTTTNAWYAHFNNGLVNYSSQTSNLYVRCVSGP